MNPTGRLHAIFRHLNRCYYHARHGEYNNQGIDIFDEDWDNLVVLDACRADTYEARATIGDYETRLSKASMTERWVEANFSNRDLRDTVYLSANGMARPDEVGARLHEYVPVWLESHRDEGHDRVCHPSELTSQAISAVEKYPEKRLLIHYVQPHVPFLGPSGDKFDVEADIPELVRDHPLREVVQAYEENLDIVLEEVERLLAALPGKTVVTADHGQLLGERLRPVPIREVGHPRGIYAKELVQVPWDVHEYGHRKTIRKGAVGENTAYDDDELAEHLEALGYA